MSIELQVEAIIFASDKPVTLGELHNCLVKIYTSDISKKEIIEAIETIKEKYESPDFAMSIRELANGYMFMTKAEYHDTLSEFLKTSSQKKLTTSALETLSIIAYKQPVTKSEMESIRGVNSDYTVQKLLEKELVEILGRKEGPGKPLLYGTSEKFMNYFGLKSIEDLPKIRDFEKIENTIGENQGIELSNGENINQ